MANLFATSGTMDSEDDDGAILAACRADPAAFSRLYQRYLGRVYRYLYFRVRERAVAEDLTSQVFLAALEGMPRYNHRGAFAAWLFAIARRKAADHFRLQRGQVSLEALHDSLSGEGDPLPRLIADEETERLEALVSSLSQDEQELLRLRFAAELSFAELAEVLRRNPAAVKMQLYRLLNRLEQLMDASG